MSLIPNIPTQIAAKVTDELEPYVQRYHIGLQDKLRLISRIVLAILPIIRRYSR